MPKRREQKSVRTSGDRGGGGGGRDVVVVAVDNRSGARTRRLRRDVSEPAVATGVATSDGIEISGER